MEPMSELKIDLFNNAMPSLDEIQKISKEVNASEFNQIAFTEQLEAHQKKSSPEDLLRVGVGLYILGRHGEAADKLQNALDCQEKFLIRAYALCHANQYDEALESLQRSLDFQADNLAVTLEKVAVYRAAQNLEAAENEIKNCGNYKNVSAEYHYQLARLQEIQGLGETAVDNYKKALELAPEYDNALFGLALRSDLMGDDELAIECYKQIVGRERCPVNALLNLAVLYEDHGDYDRASQYVWSVLEAFPNHARAILFDKDIESSKTMFFDEEREKKRSRKHQILETPISDFELSVRSRNCLKKMNITTLGDLLNISEPELLSYKNFGETSLREIKVILESKSLSLGMALEDKQYAPADLPSDEETEDQGMLSKPIDDLQLSVRARKCLQKLNMRTIGELVRMTDAELLGCKNFGVTSLNEINKALTSLGLSLRSID
jgi:DNA-directed RNA polymerase subunit alpha